MPIREVTGQGTPVDPLKKDKSSSQVKGKAGSKESKDRVEVSQEARALYEADQSKRIDEIRRKIKEGFYDRREVTEKVADAILQDIKGQK
jgi:anti-sigma28 factor (negative regulator of flagellin synthesis)